MTMNQFPTAERPILIVTVGTRGGIGKTATTATAIWTLQQMRIGSKQPDVQVAETDTHTSSMAQTGLTTRSPIDLQADDAIGHFYELCDTMHETTSHGAVDTGARDEILVNRVIEKLAPRCVKAGIDLVVLRPMTASGIVQAQAFDFIMKRPPTVGVVMVRNLSQGRTEADFKDWDATTARARCLEVGAVEVSMRSAGVANMDNAASWQLSLMDIAAGDFRRAGEDEADAARYFTRARRLFVQEWLYDHTLEFAQAIHVAIGKVTAR